MLSPWRGPVQEVFVSLPLPLFSPKPCFSLCDLRQVVLTSLVNFLHLQNKDDALYSVLLMRIDEVSPGWCGSVD